MQVVVHLELEAVENVAAPDVPLAAAARKRSGAIDQASLVDSNHAHLLHGVDKGEIPGGLAETEGSERSSSDGVPGNVLVGGETEWGLAVPCLGEVFVVPCADCRVKLLRRTGVGLTLLGGGVGTKESSEIDGREAFGC